MYLYFTDSRSVIIDIQFFSGSEQSAYRTDRKRDISLTLTCPDNPKRLEIEVKDTGIGIPRNELPYVFERFYQSSKTLKDKEGSGIGLYPVKSRTEQHKGKVTIESEENKGTTVTVTLPGIEETESDNAGTSTHGERR